MRWMMLLVFVPGLAWADGNPQIDRLWRAKCAACHGADGKAQTEQGKKMAISDLSTAAAQAKLTDAQLKTAISDGVVRDVNGVHQEMEAYKAKLRPDQIDGLVAYVRALKK
ncbi:MAG TPA: cytochrome c [Polyangia bacterium]|nr:cytochrome c [Polyangia bacterium]